MASSPRSHQVPHLVSKGMHPVSMEPHIGNITQYSDFFAVISITISIKI